jgi:Rrf2 family protein
VFSQTVEYALRAAVYLASETEGRTTDQIAETTLVPRAYLSKVLQRLGRAGLVESHRGIGGGLALTRPPSEITILDVINAVEPMQRIRSCPLGLAAHGVNLCPLHARLDDAMAQVEQAFASSTLADILNQPTRSRPLCPFPDVPAARKARKLRTPRK